MASGVCLFKVWAFCFGIQDVVLWICIRGWGSCRFGVQGFGAEFGGIKLPGNLKIMAPSARNP